MKKPLETARRWLAQAENSLSMTHTLLTTGYSAGACFHAEQTAQSALKAFLFFKGRRFVNIHSVRELALQSTQEDSEFSPFGDHGLFLDRYYLATRYPDALPDPAVPFESFTTQEAQQALDYATQIVDLVRSKIPHDSAK
jgi:HEPN domain-containing protein